MSSSRPGRPVRAREQRRVGIRERSRHEPGSDRRVAVLSAQQRHDPPGTVGVVERERSLEPGADDDHVFPAPANLFGDRAEVEQRAQQDHPTLLGRPQDRPRPVRRREDQRVGARLEELARRRADIEALDPYSVPLTADEGALDLAPQPPRLLDLGAAEHPSVSGGQRLRDGRSRAQDVDHHPDRCGGGLVRREGDMDAHDLPVR